MGKSLARKIIEGHLVCGSWEPGSEIGIRIDQTLTQDATGTLVYLEFESLGLDRVRTGLAASYVDHNLLQTDFRNADDHRYLQTSAMRYGAYFSPPGNGVSHPVHMERFGAPGRTLLGSDSHTSTAGAIGMIAIGAGGLDVALAMAGEPFHLQAPRILGVRLTGRLPRWVSAKDVILEMLRRHTVKGGVGKVVEYHGPGVGTLSATERATIANMGAELGATTTVFPSDERVREWLASQGRSRDFRHLAADPDAVYDETDEIDLSALEPLVALPGSPDNVVPVAEVEGTPVQQVIIGSSVNFSFRDLMTVAGTLRGKSIAPGMSLEINPGSRQALENVEMAGGALWLTHAGARIQQSGCLGCIGMGQAPATGTNSVRTFPRNFPGRSGTEEDQVYLASPETAVAAAIHGEITDPRRLGRMPRITEPKRYHYNREIILRPLPPAHGKKVEVARGPNIVPFPEFDGLPRSYGGPVILKVGDNITTDHILPAGNKILPLRSNIPEISKFTYERVDATFSERCTRAGGGIVVGGENYGQGSSREHAAICPRYLGIRVKIALSFARIHRGNLINAGILPLEFTDPGDYGRIKQGATLTFPRIREEVASGSGTASAFIGGDSKKTVTFRINLTERERTNVLEGGLINVVKKQRLKKK